MSKIIYTLLIASIGGIIGIKLKLPAGALIGSMAAVAIANIFGFEGSIPNNFKLVAQIVIGGMLGLGITRSTILEFKTMAIPAVVLLFSILAYGFFSGYLLWRFTELDIVTSLFSCAPGGMTEMTLMGMSLGGEGTQIATLQMLRIIGIVSLYPFLIKFFLKVKQMV